MNAIFLIKITILFFNNYDILFQQKTNVFESLIRHFVTLSKSQFQFYFDIETI